MYPWTIFTTDNVIICHILVYCAAVYGRRAFIARARKWHGVGLALKCLLPGVYNTFPER